MSGSKRGSLDDGLRRREGGVLAAFGGGLWGGGGGGVGGRIRRFPSFTRGKKKGKGGGAGVRNNYYRREKGTPGRLLSNREEKRVQIDSLMPSQRKTRLAIYVGEKKKPAVIRKKVGKRARVFHLRKEKGRPEHRKPWFETSSPMLA